MDPQLSVACTGETVLLNEMSAAAESNFALIEAIVIPIAVLIIGLRLGSARHVLIPLANLAATVLLAFALMAPIAQRVSIDPLCPSIMIALADAVCFDYALFMLVRFRDEMIDEGRSAEVWSFVCLSCR